MVTLADLSAWLSNHLADWRHTRASELFFSHRDVAVVAAFVLLGVSVAMLLVRATGNRRGVRTRLALPALLPALRASSISSVRHLVILLFLIGIPFFALALADPFTSLTRGEEAHPGRRISLMIDASASMAAPFTASRLNKGGGATAVFYTTVAAAEQFVRLRAKGKYRDLVALVEFGNEAYVVTPFTNDYANILLSISLIGDPVEFTHFPDQGTIIAQAIEQSVQLFKAFDFLNASGNLMVIFSDGEDTHAIVHGKSLDQIMAEAVSAKIPVYFIRTSYDKQLGSVLPDELWKAAVEKTGGRFFAGADEASIERAIREIDRVSAGTITVTQYSTQQPRFAPFALAALAMWTLAAFLKLTIPIFQRFP